MILCCSLFVGPIFSTLSSQSLGCYCTYKPVWHFQLKHICDVTVRPHAVCSHPTFGADQTAASSLSSDIKAGQWVTQSSSESSRDYDKQMFLRETYLLCVCVIQMQGLKTCKPGGRTAPLTHRARIRKRTKTQVTPTSSSPTQVQGLGVPCRTG